MAVDYIVNLACEPKRTAGDGDIFDGAARLLDMMKAMTRAEVMTERARQAGHDPATFTFSIIVRTATGQEQREVSLADLWAEAAPLAGYGAYCTGCPANFRGNAIAGCIGALNYPIPLAAEEWLVAQIQPVGTIGGNFLVKAIKDFSYDGAPTAQMRTRRDLYEAPTAPEKMVEKKLFRSTKVSSNQILQAIFSVGNSLDPAHCFLVLIWLGAIKMDGRVPGGTDELPRFQEMIGLAPDQRLARTSLAFGPGRHPPEAARFVGLFDAMYRAWLLDVPLLISA